MPGRQRLRRGVGHAAPLPRGAAELDLGGLGQRHLPRRAARAWPASPETLEAFLAEIERRAAAPTAASTPASRRLRDELADLDAIETRARRLVERLALALQGSLLVRHADPAVADAFCASRLAGDRGLAFGTLPAGVDVTGVLETTPPS